MKWIELLGGGRRVVAREVEDCARKFFKGFGG